MTDRDLSTLIVVGSGRSGTTIVLTALDAAVPGLVAVPRLAGRIPTATPIAALMRRWHVGPGALRRPSSESTALFTEAGMTQALQVTLGLRSMSPDDVPVSALDRLPRRVRSVQRWAGASTVALKNTASCARIPVLERLFPSAVYLEVVRHPAAVVSSLLAVDFWPSMTLWWDGRTTREYAAEESVTEEELAARHWRVQTRLLRESLESLPSERRARISYEQFTASPRDALSVLTHLGLPSADPRRLSRLGVRPAQPIAEYPQRIRQAVKKVCSEEMAMFGYSV